MRREGAVRIQAQVGLRGVDARKVLLPLGEIADLRFGCAVLDVHRRQRVVAMPAERSRDLRERHVHDLRQRAQLAYAH